jgi:molybdopterin-guanine dinucleotide biosynthesis protein A
MTQKITGVILAGGLGRRMGGIDKGLQELRGRPMMDWVIERFAPQVNELLINANQNVERYAAYGHRVVPDQIPDNAGPLAGPLAGLHAALSAATYPLVATVPCDAPFLPADLVFRLFSALTTPGTKSLQGGPGPWRPANADLAVARTFDQPQPVFCLCKREVLPHLTDFLAGGGRKVDHWYATLNVVEVAFDDEADAFANINNREELGRFEAAKE